MDDLVRLAEIIKGDVDVAKGLVGLGWNVTRLGSLVGEEGYVLEEIGDRLAEILGRPVAVRDLQALALGAEASAKLIWKGEAGRRVLVS